jgi:hypothetical protein
MLPDYVVLVTLCLLSGSDDPERWEFSIDGSALNVGVVSVRLRAEVLTLEAAYKLRCLGPVRRQLNTFIHFLKLDNPYQSVL